MNKTHKQLLSILSINPEYFTSAFGRRTISRGIDYYESGRVLSFGDVLTKGKTKRTTIIHGKVTGSGKVYKTIIGVNSNAGISLYSQCSCPVAFNCKHAVALLFAYLAGDKSPAEKSKNTINKDITAWLAEIGKTERVLEQGTDEKTPKHGDYYILYLLDTKLYAGKKNIVVTVARSRILKKGGYGRPVNLRYNDIDSCYRYYTSNTMQLTEADREIACGLRAAREEYYGYGASEPYKLSETGRAGQLLLDEILKTGRCFWQDNNKPPLTKSPARDLTLSWQDEGKNLLPQIETSPTFDKSFFLTDYYYIDIQRQQCGKLRHATMNSQQLAYFLSAPPLPKNKIQEISDKLLDIAPMVDLVIPGAQQIETCDIKDEKPQIHLKLHTGTSHNHQAINFASLTFIYHDIPFRPKSEQVLNKDVSVIVKNKVRYRIHHQHAAQNQAIETLRAHGFISMAPGETSYGLMDMHLPDKSLLENITAWDEFVTITVPQLENEGWKVIIDDSFTFEVAQIDDWYAEVAEAEEGSDWFEMSLGFEHNGKQVNLLPLLVDLLARSPDTAVLHEALKQQKYQLLHLGDNKWIKLPGKRIAQILDTLIELYDKEALNKEGNFVFAKHAGLNYNELLNNPDLHWKGADEIKALNDKIRNFSGIEDKALPQGLTAELREYQKEGFNWLQFLKDYQLNGILADDMGLGKTVQALSNLLVEKEAGRAELPSLVIAPTSLMNNWKREVERFTPTLKVLILQGMERKDKFDQIAEHDIVLTTYPLMVRDQELYLAQSFHYLILDEAQAIKNAKAKTTQIIYKIKANHRLCLTGTPLENHLGELWSMFHFLMPGFIGTYERFNRLFRTPIEKHGDAVRGQQLRKRVEPFMLRRTKDLVAKELPEKSELIRTVSLSGKQRDLYETVRLAMDKKVRAEISKKGLARSHIMILDALLKLRQVCCDPKLVKLDKARKVKESAKLELLMSMVPEMIEEGRKILIFSQFTSMLSIIENEIAQHDISYSKLTGQTRKRAEAIDKFQEGEAKIFLISLKAGGVGLNLTAADTVIHYDPWWNPAVERQATDRAHRIGQDKPVFVYKLLTENTVEEKILKLQQKKQALADSMYGRKDKQGQTFDRGDLLDLLKPLEA